MGRSRPSAIVFAAAYIAMIVGLFLALGGAAYAKSPTSAGDQYGTKVEGVQVSATAGGKTASAAAAESQALPNTGSRSSEPLPSVARSLPPVSRCGAVSGAARARPVLGRPWVGRHSPGSPSSRGLSSRTRA